ncbi:MAG: ArsR/SmtB family transcription factor [Pseudonocardia sp.]
MPKCLAVAEPGDLSGVFHALADPTRRGVVEHLGRGPASTSELARPFDMALASFTQHMGVLERAGLVTSEKRGRVRTYRLAPQPLEAAGAWLERRRSEWTRRLDQLDALLLDLGRTDAGTDHGTDHGTATAQITDTGTGPAEITDTDTDTDTEEHR